MSTQVHSGAYGVLTNALGSEILLIRKSRGPYTGLLDLPGGQIEPGESPEDAVRREFAEETGLDIHVESRIGDFDRTVNYSPNPVRTSSPAPMGRTLSAHGGWPLRVFRKTAYPHWFRRHWPC